MLKRYQVLLEDWQAEHLKLLAERVDFSFSEMVRIAVSHGLLHYCPHCFPDCRKTLVDDEALGKMSKEATSPNTSEERRHQLASKLYFEARKTAECANKKMAEEAAALSASKKK